MKNEMQVFSYQGNDIAFDFGNGQTMINATQMGKAFGKQAKDFLRLDQTKKFIDVLSQKANLPTENILKVVNGGRYFGTWMHEKLALKFAAWLSPEFELWVYDHVHQLITTGKTSIENNFVLPDFTNPVEMAREWANQYEQNAHLSQTITQQIPDVNYTKKVLQSKTTHTVTVIAKELGMSAKALNQLLKKQGIQYWHGGQWLLNYKYTGRNYTKTRTHTLPDGNGGTRTKISLVWTEKGRRFIHGVFNPSVRPLGLFD